MITIRKKVLFITVSENWNSLHNNIFCFFKFNLYRNVDKNESSSPLLIKSIETTLENDLTLDENKIFEKFTKQIRNSIRQGEKKGVECFFSKDITSFQSFYNSFALEKKIAPIRMEQFDKIEENLYISYATYLGKICAAHCYLADFEKKHVLLFRSASLRLTDTKTNANEIGKANKLLHYFDMRYFKSLGIETYGFGGYSLNKVTDFKYGINKFKTQFGGEIVQKYQYITLPYYVARLFSTALKDLNYLIMKYINAISGSKSRSK